MFSSVLQFPPTVVSVICTSCVLCVLRVEGFFSAVYLGTGSFFLDSSSNPCKTSTRNIWLAHYIFDVVLWGKSTSWNAGISWLLMSEPYSTARVGVRPTIGHWIFVSCWWLNFTATVTVTISSFLTPLLGYTTSKLKQIFAGTWTKALRNVVLCLCVCVCVCVCVWSGVFGRRNLTH